MVVVYWNEDIFSRIFMAYFRPISLVLLKINSNIKSTHFQLFGNYFLFFLLSYYLMLTAAAFTDLCARKMYHYSINTYNILIIFIHFPHPKCRALNNANVCETNVPQ